MVLVWKGWQAESFWGEIDMGKERRKELQSFGPLPKWKILEGLFGFKNLLNLYPPYLASGITVEYVSEDFRTIRVKMCLNFLNENYVGVHFGGSLYAMCDPWYMFILMRELGDRYMVWDQSACIEFLHPGTGCVTSEFSISPDECAEIRRILQDQKKTKREYHCFVKDERERTIAKVKKVLYIRRLTV